MKSASHIKPFALPKSEEKVEALKNKSNCPSAINEPPAKIAFLFPIYLSAIKPPKSGVK